MEQKSIKVPKILWQQLKAKSTKKEIPIYKVIEEALNKKDKNK
jgi:hypothetical protein